MSPATMRRTSQRIGSVAVDPIATRPIPLNRDTTEAELRWTRERLALAEQHDAALAEAARRDGRIPVAGASARVVALRLRETQLAEALERFDSGDRVAADQAHRAAEQEAP